MEPSLLEQREAESKRAALQEASLREEVIEDRVEAVSDTLSKRVDSVPAVMEERDGVLKARISGDSVSYCLPLISWLLCLTVTV